MEQSSEGNVEKKFRLQLFCGKIRGAWIAAGKESYRNGVAQGKALGVGRAGID